MTPKFSFHFVSLPAWRTAHLHLWPCNPTPPNPTHSSCFKTSWPIPPGVTSSVCALAEQLLVGFLYKMPHFLKYMGLAGYTPAWIPSLSPPYTEQSCSCLKLHPQNAESLFIKWIPIHVCLQLLRKQLFAVWLIYFDIFATSLVKISIVPFSSEIIWAKQEGKLKELKWERTGNSRSLNGKHAPFKTCYWVT